MKQSTANLDGCQRSLQSGFCFLSGSCCRVASRKASCPCILHIYAADHFAGHCSLPSATCIAALLEDSIIELPWQAFFTRIMSAYGSETSLRIVLPSPRHICCWHPMLWPAASKILLWPQSRHHARFQTMAHVDWALQ